MACRGGSPNAVENKSFIIKKGQHSFSNVFYSLKNSRFSLARCFTSVTCYTFCSLSYTTQHLINIYISWNLPISPIFVLFRKCIQKVCDRSAVTVMGRHRHKRWVFHGLPENHWFWTNFINIYLVLGHLRQFSLTKSMHVRCEKGFPQQ